MMQSTASIACNLTAMTPSQRQRHEEILTYLRGAVKEVEELLDGYAFRYEPNPDLVMVAAEFITLESQCCPFFSFALGVGSGNGPVWLRVTGPEEAKSFIQKA